jgi:hypothetical protein
MAKEHHCPNDGPQPCNASTSRIHTCGLCNATWEEDLSGAVTLPPVQAPKLTVPPTPAPGGAGSAPLPVAKPAPQNPVTTATKPAPFAAPASPKPSPTPTPTPAKSVTAPASPIPAEPTPSSVAPQPASQAPDRKPSYPIPPPGEKSTSETYRDEVVGSVDALDQKIASAKFKTCPGCRSTDLLQASQYIDAGGRLVLGDSQSYRGHWWYADTGELYQPPVTKVALKASA